MSSVAGATTASLVAEWLARFVENVLCGSGAGEITGVVYSEFAGGFIRAQELQRMIPRSQWEGTLPAEYFIDKKVHEARCLVRMLGPFGFRVLERRLLGVMGFHSALIRKLISMCKGELEHFARVSLVSSSETIDAALKVSRSREIVHSLTAVGNCLMLRKMLREALGQENSALVPQIHSCISRAYTSYAKSAAPSVWDPTKETTDILASDAGIHTANVDRAVAAVLHPLKASKEDADVWDVLPYVIGASFVSDAWKKGDISTTLDAQYNNSHVVAVAAAELIAALSPISNRGGGGATSSAGGRRDTVTTSVLPGYMPESNQIVRDSMHRMLRCAAAVLLKMKAEESARFREWPLRGMFIFLEKIINATPLLSYHDLERALPYALLHAAFVDISLGRRHGYEEGKGAEEFTRMAVAAKRMAATMQAADEDKDKNKANDSQAASSSSAQ